MKMNVRKIGGDMTNALLWAAFAIVVLISILSTYQVVMFNKAKQDMSMTFTAVSTEFHSWPFSYSDGLGTTDYALTFRDAGAYNDSDVGTDGMGTYLKLPYESRAYFYPGGSSNYSMTVAIYFGDNQRARWLCTASMAGREAGVTQSGLLGFNYEISGGDCSQGTPVVAFRMRPQPTSAG